MKDNLENNLKLMARSSLVVFLALLISKFLVYIYKVVIARYFGPEIYGLYSLGAVIAGLFISIASLGLSEGMLRFVALYRGKNQSSRINYLFKFSMRILIFSSLLGGIILFFLAEPLSINVFHNPSLIFYLKLFSITIPFGVIAYAILTLVRSYEQIGWYLFISTISRNLLEIVFLLLFIFIGLKNEAIAFSYVLGFAGMFALSYWILNSRIRPTFKTEPLPKKEKKKVSSELLKYSLPLIFSTFIFMLMAFGDTFAIGYFKSSLEVGWYNAALPIAMLLTLAPELFIKLFFPLINKEYSKKNMHLISELSKQVSKWIFLLNLPLLMVILIMPEASLNLLFGSEYISAANALRILALGYFVSSSFSAITLRIISMTGRSKLILFNTALVAILNIFLNIILVPMNKIGFIENTSGLAGAALATLLSLIIMGILLTLQANHYASIIPVRRSMFRLVIASIIPAIILLYVKNNFVIGKISFVMISLFFLLFYLLCVLFFKGFDRNDWMVINSIRKKLNL